MSRGRDVVVVYKPDHIGDVVLTTPLFRHLRERLGDSSELIAVVGPWAAEVLTNNPFVDRVLPFVSAYMNRQGQLAEGERVQNSRTLHVLINKRPQWVINVRDDYGHVLHAYAMGLGRAVLISHVAHHPWHHLVSEPVVYDGALHEAVQHIGLLRPFGLHVRDSELRPEVFPSTDDFARADALLSLVDLDRAVCVFPGGGHPLNYWPITRFVSVAERLAAAGRVGVFVGGMNEAELLFPFRERLSACRALNLTGKTTLLQLAAVCKRIGRMLTNDGGPMHLAAAAGADVIALFGSSRKAFYPYGDHLVLDQNWWCRPCPHFTYDRHIQCADNICMQSISLDQVWDAVEARWFGISNGRSRGSVRRR